MPATRVCVIGAGPSGLSTLRAFQLAADRGESIPEIRCFDKQNDWGGQWNYTWRVGLDQNNHPVHSSMYKYLWSNAPKECLEFGDYSFEQHFGRDIASYPPRAVLLDYITGRARLSNIRHMIQFNTLVEHVRYDQQAGQFEVSTVLCSNGVRLRATEWFDYVICASGHYSYPNYPHYPGFGQFQGRILHAHDLKDACEFSGKDVLIIGTSYSAEDIASQCWKYGANSITISHRTKPIGYHTWPHNITEVPLLSRVESSFKSDGSGELQAGGVAHFVDGSTKHIDAIILCTGYVFHFPFLTGDLLLDPEHCAGQPANRIWLKGLYRGMFWIKNPRLIHIGPHTGFFTMPLFDAQAWLCRDYIMGKYALPSVDQMREHDEMMCRKCEEIGTEHYDEGCIHFQGDYMGELAGLSDYPEIDVQEYKNRFFEWEEHKQQNIMTFRDNCYKNVFTHAMSPRLVDRDGSPVKWKDAMCEDCENFGMSDLYDGNTRKPLPIKAKL